ncbi:MAG: ArnT family glycosyltransferase [Terrimicrobiaceae bacterium]
MSGASLRAKDYGILALLALLLFGYGTISGKPLTMHEGRLPQCAREMLANGNWLIPQSGGIPWLEFPPFPHWVEILTGHVFGRLDAVWIARIPPALMGLLTVLLAAWTAARLFGRQIGLLSGAALATMYEFYFYAGQAEDDIFLAFLMAVCVAAFVATEFPRGDIAPDQRRHFLGNRPWTVWLFFLAMGMTSLAKGLLLGAGELAVGFGTFLLLSWRENRLGRYVWLWGWLLFFAVSASWSVYAGSLYPGLWDSYRHRYLGSMHQESPWYYLTTILWTSAPWTLMWLLGIFLVWPRKGERWTPANCFLLCWAVGPLLVLSIPLRKHHHYLVPVLPAFAVLAAFGLQRVGEVIARFGSGRIPGLLVGLLVGLAGCVAFVVLGLHQIIPGPVWLTCAMGGVVLLCSAFVGLAWEKKNGRRMLEIFCAGFVVFAAWGQTLAGLTEADDCGDFAFLERVNRIVPADEPLIINAYGSLDFFRLQFSLRPGTVALPNVTYLRDEEITNGRVYLIARAGSGDFLARLGDCEVLDASTKARRETSPADRFTLFRITFRPDLERYPAPPVLMHAAGKEEETRVFCGPPPEGNPAFF